MKITYRNRVFIDAYRCIDHESTLTPVKSFWNGNLLYCYVDRYNIKVISKDDIINIEEV